MTSTLRPLALTALALVASLGCATAKPTPDKDDKKEVAAEVLRARSFPPLNTVVLSAPLGMSRTAPLRTKMPPSGPAVMTPVAPPSSPVSIFGMQPANRQKAANSCHWRIELEIKEWSLIASARRSANQSTGIGPRIER